jgi:hypothetical protein
MKVIFFMRGGASPTHGPLLANDTKKRIELNELETKWLGLSYVLYS